MAWLAPKTDWYGYTDENKDYHGDRFNATDFNRIKNNLQHLRNLAVKMYDDFRIADMGEDRSYEEYPYADELNEIESNLDIIIAHTLRGNYGARKFYMDEGAFIDFSELNRIESATLDMYNKLTNQFEGRKMLRFMFGPIGGI